MNALADGRAVSVTDARIVWRCGTCGDAVEGGAGYVTVDQATADAHRRAWHEFETRKRGESPGGWVAYRLSELPDAPRASWVAYHRACDPRPDSDDYWFDVDRADTPRRILHWVGHLHGKNWIAGTDLDDLCLEIGTYA